MVFNGFAMGKGVGIIMDDNDSRDIIENFTKICQLEVIENHDESNEKTLFELSEYVRMGAMFIYDQFNTTTREAAGSEVYH